MTSASLMKSAVSPMTRTFLKASRPRPGVVLVSAELMDILNPVPRMVSPKRMRPYTARRAAMLADVSAAICRAQTNILDAMHRYPEFAEITDAYLD